MLDALEAAKLELENDYKQLSSEKASLETQKASLDAKNYQMQAKQSELTASITQAQMTQEEAAAAQREAQEAIESDEMDYEAVQDQIQSIISSAAAKQSDLSFTGFICPLRSYSRISSEYGYRTNPVTGVYKLHGGIDFAAPGGTPIYAAASGYVSVAGWSTGGYGNYVVIYHGTMGDGKAYSTLYGHMSRIAARQGTYVNQGDIIGYVGSTGNSTGNHLHSPASTATAPTPSPACISCTAASTLPPPAAPPSTRPPAAMCRWPGGAPAATATMWSMCRWPGGAPAATATMWSSTTAP